MTGFFERALAPELELQPPVCRACRNEVFDEGDGWECKTCHVHWPSSDGWDGTPWEFSNGEFQNIDVPACGASYEVDEGAWGTRILTCVLDEGHYAAEKTHHISTKGDEWEATL